MIGSTKTKTLKRIQFSANNTKNVSRHKKRKKRTNQSNITQRAVRSNKTASTKFKDLNSRIAKYRRFCICLQKIPTDISTQFRYH